MFLQFGLKKLTFLTAIRTASLLVITNRIFKLIQLRTTNELKHVCKYAAIAITIPIIIEYQLTKPIANETDANEWRINSSKRNDEF